MSVGAETPRVLLVSPEYPPTPGGVGDYTALLARHLRNAGASIAVLTSGTGGDTDEDNVRVLRRVPGWGRGLTRHVRDAVRDTGAEIVHIQYQTGMYGMHPAVSLLPLRGTAPPSPRSTSGAGENRSKHWAVPHASMPTRFSPSPVSRRGGRGVRFITTFHDLLPPYLFPKAGPLRNGVTRLLARTSDGVIATNGADMATLRRWGVRATLVPIGSNIAAPHPQNWRHAVIEAELRDRYGFSIDDAFLSTFGLTNRSKGLDTAIDALALLHEQGVSAFLLVIGAGAGANDPTNAATEAALRERIEARGLAGRIAFTGPLSAEDVAWALMYSEVCLLPYRDGASPRRGSLLAALAQGVPVVTTAPRPGAYDGLPPLTDEIAVFVPPDDAAALAAAVRRILADDKRLSEMRRRAKEYAAQFGWGAIARRTLAVYRGERHATWAATETGL